MSAALQIPWYPELTAAALKPFLATSEALANFFDLSPWGIEVTPFFLEDDDHGEFLRAYLCADRFAYGGWAEVATPGQDRTSGMMEGWVFVDCVLLQSAAIGLMMPQARFPDWYLRHLAEAGVDLDRVPWLPISGEATTVRADGRALVGLSTFNLHRPLFGTSGWARESHALALGIRRAVNYDWFYAVTQYANHAIRLHGRFGSDPVILKPSVPVYSAPESSFLYRMKIDFDPRQLDTPPARTPDRLVRSRDSAAKRQIAAEIAQGWCHTIVPPYWLPGDDQDPPQPCLTVSVSRPSPAAARSSSR